MRLRRIPQAKSIISKNTLIMTEEGAKPGEWRELLNISPCGVLNLEIGMGRGRFITSASFNQPDQGWLGLEIREEMHFMAIRRLQGQIPDNLRFLWMDASALAEVFVFGEIDNIYLQFSDPWPKARHAKRRLTHENFLAVYHEIISPEGKIIFKTDNRDFFLWSKERFLANDWQIIEESGNLSLKTGDIITEYEERYRNLGMPIFLLILKQ